MKHADLPEEIYDISAVGHLTRAIYLRRNLMEIHPLQVALYAARELRNAIERLLFEYLVILHGSENISTKIEKAYRAVDLTKLIEEVEPELEQKIEFRNLAIRANGGAPAGVPDLDALSDLYGCLNNYLHAWKRRIRATKT